jgi:putative transposase
MCNGSRIDVRKKQLVKTKPRGRRSIRLPGYDYTQPGACFVNICTQNHLPTLGRILGGEIVLSKEGKIIMNRLEKTPDHLTNTTLDTYVIMLSHIHLIIILTDHRKGEASATDSTFLPFESKADASPLQPNDTRPRGSKRGSLGAIIQNLKSVSTRKINQLHKTPRKRIWQRNFFEHIIRSERALNAIRHYIQINPNRWELDRYNPNAVGSDREAEALWNQLREKEVFMGFEVGMCPK